MEILNNIQPWHIGFLVNDILRARKSMQNLPGMGSAEVIEIAFPAEDMEVGRPLNVKVCNLPYMGTILELIQPVNCPDSYISQEIDKRGSGIHHMAYALPGIYDETVSDLTSKGWKVCMAANHLGIRNCFVESQDGSAVLELIEKIPG